MRTPLLGTNIVRLAYLDEAGISVHEPALCVAGVLIHGDQEAIKVQQAIDAVVERYVSEPHLRIGFVFSAKEVFHGSGYFDRRKPEWKSQEKRIEVLSDLAEIIHTLKLPVVCGFYLKATFGTGLTAVELAEINANHEHKRVLLQTTAAMDCAIWTDRWLERFAPDQNAIIIAEDTDRVKPLMKAAIKVLRTPALVENSGLKDIPGLPLKRIVDTVHFASKADSQSLQLADLCAFTMGRLIKDKPVSLRAAHIIFNYLKWIPPYEKYLTKFFEPSAGQSS